HHQLDSFPTRRSSDLFFSGAKMAADSPKNTSGRGQRELKVKVKTAKGRKLSSTRWLERQLNDPYVARARREGFRGRAAFKIVELDRKSTRLNSSHVKI